jgi:calpain
LVSGDPNDAKIDLTGGVRDSFDLKRCLAVNDKSKFIDPNVLWEIIVKSTTSKSLLSCSADSEGRAAEAKLPNGLVVQHAYSVLSCLEIVNKNGIPFSGLRALNEPPFQNSIRLLKIRNPWGQDQSYKGRFSQNTKDWDQIAPSLRIQLGHDKQLDGEFYMAFDDFLKFFHKMDTVHSDLSAMNTVDLKSNQRSDSWQVKQFQGEWIPGKNSGGSGNFKHEFSIFKKIKGLFYFFTSLRIFYFDSSQKFLFQRSA